MHPPYLVWFFDLLALSVGCNVLLWGMSSWGVLLWAKIVKPPFGGTFWICGKALTVVGLPSATVDLLQMHVERLKRFLTREEFSVYAQNADRLGKRFYTAATYAKSMVGWSLMMGLLFGFAISHEVSFALAGGAIGVAAALYSGFGFCTIYKQRLQLELSIKTMPVPLNLLFGLVFSILIFAVQVLVGLVMMPVTWCMCYVGLFQLVRFLREVAPSEATA